MNKFVWILIVVGSIALHAMQFNLSYSIGFILPWFILGVVMSPIYWFATKSRRTVPWQWFDWLNTGAVIMVSLFILRVAFHFYMGLYEMEPEAQDSPATSDVNVSLSWRKGTSPSIKDWNIQEPAIYIVGEIDNQSSLYVESVRYTCSYFDNNGNRISKDENGVLPSGMSEPKIKPNGTAKWEGYGYFGKDADKVSSVTCNITKINKIK
jgi:hypothetical protein